MKLPEEEQALAAVAQVHFAFRDRTLVLLLKERGHALLMGDAVSVAKYDAMLEILKE